MSEEEKSSIGEELPSEEVEEAAVPVEESPEEIVEEPSAEEPAPPEGEEEEIPAEEPPSEEIVETPSVEEPASPEVEEEIPAEEPPSEEIVEAPSVEEKKEKKKKEKKPKKEKKGKGKLIALGIILVIILSLAVFVITGLKERAAEPALIDSSVLTAQKWAQSGGVTQNVIIVKVSSLNLTINTATANYEDEGLSAKINSLATLYGLTVTIPSSVTSRMKVVRIAPPSIVDLMGDMMVSQATTMIESQYTQEITNLGITGLSKTGTTQLNIGGKTVTASVYEGSFNQAGLSGSVKGILAVWSTDKGITAVAGVAPSGSIEYQTITIELGDDEYNELTALAEAVT